MRVALIALAIAACAACDVADPVVDRLPPPPPPPPDERIGGALCPEPPLCEDKLELGGEVTALRSLHASIAGLDEDAGSDDVLDPDAIDWKGDSIVLGSAVPIDVVHDEAPEPGTLIELRGPVTLHFENIARLERVRIAGSSPESRLVLEHVTARDLTLGDADHPFAGQLEAKHTAFTRASVNAARVTLDSVVFVDSFIATDTLASRDGLIKQCIIELGAGLFAPSDVRDTELRRCDALSFFGSRLLNVSIPRCRSDVPTRFYETTIVTGLLDGLLNADSSTIEGVRVGRDDETSLVMWDTQVLRMALCDRADDVRLELATVQCSSCTEDALETRICQVSEKDSTTGSANFCERIDQTTRCEDPLPERLRPHLE